MDLWDCKGNANFQADYHHCLLSFCHGWMVWYGWYGNVQAKARSTSNTPLLNFSLHTLMICLIEIYDEN